MRIEAKVVQGKLVEQYSVQHESKWTELAVSDGLTQGALSVKGPGGETLTGGVTKLAANGDELLEEIDGSRWTIHRIVRVINRKHWVHILETFQPTGPITLHSFTDVFHVGIDPTWAYSPSVGGFNPDGMYKAPLILVQRENLAFGIVPDLLALDRSTLKRCNHALDLNIPGRTLASVGFIPAIRAFHTVFKEDLDRTWITDGPVENDYFLYLSGEAPPSEAYREPVTFQWSEFGRAALPIAASEQAGTDPKYLSCHLWDDWRKVVWEQESPSSWLTIQMPDGTLGGAVSMHRAGNPRRSVYLSAWFNSMRTAYGMALYAQRTQNENLLDLAGQTLNLAMKAPGRDGTFKCFAIGGDSVGPIRWGAGDGAGNSVAMGYLGFDMSWTGYWMLKWHQARLPGGDAVIRRCSRLADFLIARQTRNGMLPSRFDEAGFVQQNLSDNVPAETAPIVRFLFELYKANGDARYLQAARKGLDYLDRSIVPERKWFDFETFWSCSPRLVALDQRTRQWPANDLALIHAVAAYLQAYQITHETRYLRRGKALLDYLLLFQQSWTNPALDNLTSPVMLLGGFTTQNSDGEWSDARQSLAGEAILDYYRETGDAEYLERGVEALRAQFPVSPSENWAHQAYGGKAGVSSFHWGTGSGLASIEMEENYLHDAVCDISAQRCVGVNGLNISAWRMDGPLIDLQINSPYTWTRRPVVVFYRGQASCEYRLSVNGTFEGRFTGKRLESGVPVTMP
jgi:hypothetical protein